MKRSDRHEGMHGDRDQYFGVPWRPNGKLYRRGKAKRGRQRIKRALLAGALALILTGCGGGWGERTYYPTAPTDSTTVAADSLAQE